VTPGHRSVPPGRAGRVWLRRRLRTARRGREQMDRRLRILLPLRRGLVAVVDQQRHDWSVACEEAATWLRRAAVLGGEDALDLARSGQPVGVEVAWVSSMGVTFPVEARVARTGPEVERLWGNPALAPAAAAAWRMVEAAAALAVTEEALRRLDAEISLTRRRLRVLDQRWLPQLTGALTELELVLEQTELEDGIRLRHGGATGARRTLSGP
jgi:V/A-type H+-transporting ATPase subunit D